MNGSAKKVTGGIKINTVFSGYGAACKPEKYRNTKTPGGDYNASARLTSAKRF